MSEKVGSDIERRLKLNFQIDLNSIEDDINQIQSRSMSDPSLSDIAFINEMTWV